MSVKQFDYSYPMSNAMKTLITSYCIVLLCVACNPQDTTTTVVKDNSGNKVFVAHYQEIKDTVVINLSDLVEDYELIRFEDNDSALLGFRVMPTITEHYIGISQMQDGQLPYLLFDRQGNFLCNVGNAGQGPGEYAWSIYDAAISEQKGEVYLAQFAFVPKILVYNLQGKLTHEIETDCTLAKPKIETDDEGNLCILQIPMPSQKSLNLAIQMDGRGNVARTLKAKERFWMKDFNGELFAYHNVPEFSFHITNCDTLFHYDRTGNRVVPKFTLDFGLMDEKPVHIYNEIPGYYITNVFGEGTIFTDKQKRTSYYARIVNDYCGHMENPVLFKDGYAYWMHEPARWIHYIEKRLGRSDCSDADRKQLTELLESIDEEGNNLMFIGKLK